MPDNDPQRSSGHHADRDVFDLRNTSIHVHGNFNAGGGPAAPARRAITSTVPAKSATFIPRKNITAQIHAALRKNPGETVIRQAVARAMGGYGKTVAAVLYAHEYAKDYPGGRFMLPMENGDIIAGLASLIGPLGLTSRNDPTADATTVSHALREGDPSLLILDNIPSAKTWTEIVALRLPGTTLSLLPYGRCHILVTTRDEAIAPSDAIKIGRLTSDEARELFRLFCQDRQSRETNASKRAALPAALPEPAIADAITNGLGGLAVAVAAVAAYMKLKPHIDWKVYWLGDGKLVRGLKNTPVKDLPEVKPEVAAQLGLNGQALEEHRRSLRVVDDAFEALAPPERRAVEYAALLPHDLAPRIWLETLLQTDAARTEGPLLLTLASDPDDPRPPAQRVLDHLDELDILMPGGEEGKLLSLHRLWHTRVNERAAAEQTDRTPLLLAIAECADARGAAIVGTGETHSINTPAIVSDADAHTRRWELSPLVATSAMLWAQGHPGPAARLGIWLASVLRELGRYAEAAACLPLNCETDLAIEAAIGHKGVAAVYSNLATIQRVQGNFAGARASMEKAIAIAEQNLGADQPNLASMRSNLALIQQDLGDLSAARTNIEKTIAIQSKHFPPDHPGFAISFSNLALIQKTQGDLAGARANVERAIVIAEQRLGANHPNLATMHSNLSGIQKAQRDVAGARTSIEKAIAIQSTHLPPDHPIFATSYNNLAMILKDLNKFAEALRYKQLSIEIERKHFGEDHPQMGASYSNLAGIQKAQGDLAGARSSIEKALAVLSRHFAPDHPTLAIRYNNLAHICFAEGDQAAACVNLKRALIILLKHFDENHPHVKVVRDGLKIIGCPDEGV
ncbi:MAG: tetratricopeptide repeat protein [Phycisphaerales bacterium]|nr:tetratricopeptide repeat protein [Phycisphaerales bacterium]